ncbi:MAG: hypothetical protein A2Y38_21095 [Spirochaetes bacterium GWB1_59_5]|nr:MAG: hypothetical protein A2Y38_21095 [Spirochaetes bacterium GWB1_59_5]
MDNQPHAFNMLFTDLVENILSMADSPGRCADYLSENLRALIGARTVLVLECTHFSGEMLHEIISIFPERRRSLGYHEAVQNIAEFSHKLEHTAMFEPHEGGPIADALGRLNIDSAIVAPIKHGEERMGVLLLLDLLDTTGSKTVMETLDRLTPAFALVLRNAFLYNNLELEVARRTRDLKERTASLQMALAEKEVMLKEVHHRVKNNLQIVTSLLFLQADSSKNSSLREALKKSRGRIQSMALVHEELYQSEDLASVDMNEYVRKLCADLAEALESTVPIVFRECALRLPITQSIPCGLILNELVTNALKYAYPDGRSGEIRVSMLEDHGMVRLAVEDDGVGLASSMKNAETCSLGLSLVDGLAAQLHGQLKIVDKSVDQLGGYGVRFEIDFPGEEP